MRGWGNSYSYANSHCYAYHAHAHANGDSYPDDTNTNTVGDAYSYAEWDTNSDSAAYAHTKGNTAATANSAPAADPAIIGAGFCYKSLIRCANTFAQRRICCSTVA